MTERAKLFGTDGVRGRAGSELTVELALALGRTATEHAKQWFAQADTPASVRPQVVIVRDTRESGPMLESAVAAGVAAAGGDALLAGVLPTPAAALLVKRYNFTLGVVVSASHNPYADNGIKFFGPNGFKLDDDQEAAIELSVEQCLAGKQEDSLVSETADIGGVRSLNGALGDYLRELEGRFGSLDLDGLKVVLDCANGATFNAAPEIFRRLGATVETLYVAPDGRNINAGCGSTHPEALIEKVTSEQYDIGFAFDGDGDRVLAVDRNGRLVDGDELIALAANHLHRSGSLSGGGVAVTVMTNYGFHAEMAKIGVEVAVTGVGDRQILAELDARNWQLGGEQSGHIIQMGFAPSGDGIASALLTLEALAGGDLASMDFFERLPQTLVNVRVRDREAIHTAKAVWAAVEQESAALEGKGRVLVRPSGTEPLVRVMVEAPTVEEAEAVCGRLVTAVEQELA